MYIHQCLVHTPAHTDADGTLCAWDERVHFPFTPCRAFTLTGMTAKAQRGKHAHLKCQQFLVCLTGSVSIEMSDGYRWSQTTLDKPNQGLYVPPLTWIALSKFARHTAIVVLCSEPYDEKDYVRDFDKFATMRGAGCRQGGA